MPALAVALVLGLVEGLTEFLPVSSTGHLILVGHALGFAGEQAAAFEVVIQGAAMLAVVWLYRARFVACLRPAAPGRFGGARGAALLSVAAAPILVVGFLLRHPIQAAFTPAVVAAAVATGGVAILALERFRGDRGTGTVDGLGFAAALGIGLFQCLALWPGFSRAAATIGGAMLLGLTRRAAAEFSFLVAAPVLLAVSAYKAIDVRDAISGDAAAFYLVGAAVSAVTAALAVKGFVALLGRMTLAPFGWYRLVLAALVVAVLVWS